MGDLAELLELMHTSLTRWQTLQAIGWEWRDLRLTGAASQRAYRSFRSASSTRLVNPDEGSEQAEVRDGWHVWIGKPDKARAEFAVEDETVSAVVIGDTWWSWSPTRGVTTNDGDPSHSQGMGPGHDLIDPSAILPAVELQVVARDSFIGRPVVRVVATASRIDQNDEEGSDWLFATHRLGVGADDYSLLVDAERGVLLRSEARIDGEPFRILEMESVAFDEALAEAVFAPPKDQEVEPVSVSREVPLSQLQDAVPFTVFVPESPPFGPEYAVIHPPERRHRIPEQVHIIFAEDLVGKEDREFSLVQSAEPLPNRDEIDWREQGGLQFGELMHPRLRIVRLELGGTHIELRTYVLSFEELLELAHSLVPLPPSPPLPPETA